jgi:hypothetical protein
MGETGSRAVALCAGAFLHSCPLQILFGVHMAATRPVWMALTWLQAVDVNVRRSFEARGH